MLIFHIPSGPSALKKFPKDIGSTQSSGFARLEGSHNSFT